MRHEPIERAGRWTAQYCTLLLGCLLAVTACSDEAPPATQVPTVSPPRPPASIRIAYTSDSLGHTDPQAAVNCG